MLGEFYLEVLIHHVSKSSFCGLDFSYVDSFLCLIALSVGRDSNQLSLSSSTSQIPTFGACSTTPTTTSTSTTASGTPASSSSTSSSSKTDTSRSSTDSTQTSREEIRSKTATPKSEIDEYPVPLTNMPLQEPDVIASTKLAHSKTTDSIITNRPVPPPRQKRRGTANKDQLASSISKPLSSSTENVSTVPKVHPKVTRSDSATQLKLVMPPSNAVSAISSTTTTTQSRDTKMNEDLQQAIPCSPGTIDAIQRELENSFAKAATSTPNAASFAAFKQSSIARISHSLGNSVTSVAVTQQTQHQQQPQVFAHPNSKPSPSNSAKSNSAPARVR